MHVGLLGWFMIVVIIVVLVWVWFVVNCGFVGVVFGCFFLVRCLCWLWFVLFDLLAYFVALGFVICDFVRIDAVMLGFIVFDVYLLRVCMLGLISLLGLVLIVFGWWFVIV